MQYIAIIAVSVIFLLFGYLIGYFVRDAQEKQTRRQLTREMIDMAKVEFDHGINRAITEIPDDRFDLILAIRKHLKNKNEEANI